MLAVAIGGGLAGLGIGGMFVCYKCLTRKMNESLASIVTVAITVLLVFLAGELL